MLTKEEIVEYFKELHHKCDTECPFVKECSVLMYDSEGFLCDYITNYSESKI